MTIDAGFSRHVILSGCSGGGKSTLVGELAARGFATVPEPGRRIVAEELLGDGRALPWVDMKAFAMRAIDVAIRDRELAGGRDGWTFFDRGLVDAAVALEHTGGASAIITLAPFANYHAKVFLTPPWPEIYVTDAGRRHDMAEAVAEYDRLLIAYRELGYEAIILPKAPVEDRADFLLGYLF